MPSTIKRIREKWRAKGLKLPRSRSRTSSSSEDIGDSAETPEPPTLSKLYGEAAEYEKVLASNGCIDGQATHHDGTNGLVDLVDRHLGQLEEAVTDHVARPSVEEWPSSDEVNVSGEEGVGVVPDGPKTERDTIVSTPVIRRPEVSIDDPWKLEPPKIIDLFVEEFGPLAADGEEEKLVLETDGFLIHDVVIVGVIHLTTHRLAFHASLFDSQPDLPALKRVIKAGPATLHRKGWRTKRRVWLELSHDMLCAYPSSSDEGKDRPLDTILFIFINSLLPLDPLQPRYIHIELGIGAHKRVDDFEFDTEESARDWRRELEGALFLHRHRRREVINAILPEETGVRLSIPLNRIAHVRFGSYSDFPFTVSLVVRSEHGDELDHPEQPTIHLGTITPSQVWTQLDGYIAAASRRLLEKRTGDDSPVFIDFGPLTFHERRAMPKEEMPRLKDMAIRGALNLDSDDAQLWIVPARIYRNISSSGYLVLSQHFVHFWSKSLTPADVKYRIPVLDIQSFKPFHVSFCRLHGITIDIKEKPSLKFLFRNASMADEAVERITALVNTAHSLASESPSTTLTRTVSWPSELSADSRSLRSHTRSATAVIAPLSRSLAAAVAVGIPPPVQLTFPKAINLPREIVAGLPPMHFVCLTIGSRGDVQPYIALGLGLKKEGHRVTIVTHEEYKMWIESFGIGHRTAGGDPAALMKLSVDHKMFSPDFFRESLGKFRPWLDQLLLQAWEACHDADVLLESPSAMAGVHIAEALSIPYFRTFTMPWTKSSEFPHPFLSPPVEAPAFNSASYILFNNVMWTATSGQINRWRRKVLNLHNTDMGHLAQSKIVTIYCFSQAVVPKPLDWGDTINISGYWFLDNPDLTWSPPQDLLDWMYKARMDGKPIVYIGFGSITVPHPNEVTSRIVRAVLKSDVRAVVAKGWSARRSDERDAAEVEIPPECYVVEKIPHDWLFPRVDAALHHGGAGTTGASLRAGIPTLIKPWFGDQYFWAQRVQKLGAGMRVGSLRVSDMADALTKATTNPAMKQKAAHVGEIIRSEDGVHSAIHTIYTYLPRAARKYDAGD